MSGASVSGVQDAGGAVLGGLESAADAVDDTPLIGDDLAGALEGAGAGHRRERGRAGRARRKLGPPTTR
jgi:hypothetical protein